MYLYNFKLLCSVIVDIIIQPIIQEFGKQLSYMTDITLFYFKF